MMDSLTQQQESFATSSATDTPDGLLVTATEPAVDEFGCSTFSAMELKRTFHNVDTISGAVTTAHTVKMCQSLALQQLDWLEDQVHEKDVLKCITVEVGEQCVVVTSMTQQRELFATCSGTDTPDGLLVTATEPAAGQFGWTTFSAVERKRTSIIVDTEAGAVTTVHTVKMFQFHVLK